MKPMAFISVILTSTRQEYNQMHGLEKESKKALLSLCVLNYLREINKYICDFFDFLMLQWHRWLKSFIVENKDPFLLQSQ